MHDDDMTQRPHEGRMNAEWSFLALFVAVLGASAGIAAPTPPAHQCSDPCLQAARDARAECVSSACVPGRAEGGEGPVSERVPARVEEAADLHRPGADRGLPVSPGRPPGSPAGAARLPFGVRSVCERMRPGRAAGRRRHVQGGREGRAAGRPGELQGHVPGDGEWMQQQGRHVRPGMRRCPRCVQRPDTVDARRRNDGVHGAGEGGRGGLRAGEPGRRLGPRSVPHHRAGERLRLPPSRARGRRARLRRLYAAVPRLRQDLSGRVETAGKGSKETMGGRT